MPMMSRMTDPQTIKVRLLMFGGLASSTGAGEETLEVQAGLTAGQLLALVGRRWPGAAPILERVTVAVNLETVSSDHPISDGDEVALLPPVAGGAAPRITSGVRTEAISIDEVMALVADPGAGGTVVFVGTVRDHSDGWEGVEQLDYSVYRDMAEPLLARIAQEAAERWPLNGVCILHRVGTLPVGEQTVVVAASAPHRGEAFEAARYGIDEVKRRVPVWKLERGPNGERWIGIDSPAEGGGNPGVAGNGGAPSAVGAP